MKTPWNKKYQNICVSDLYNEAFGQACWIKDDLPGQLQVSTFSINKNEYYDVQLFIYTEVKFVSAVSAGGSVKFLPAV